MSLQTKTISIISTKGGSGKTTLTANLAGYLTSIGKKVLMIDVDPQPSLSSYYQIESLIKDEYGNPMGLSNICKDPIIVNDCINKTHYGDIIISNDPKYQLQTYLLNEADGRLRIKSAIENLTNQYDFIIIDTQGSKGALQDASVLAADILLSPIVPEIATIREFQRGTLSLLKGLGGYKALGLNLPELFGFIYKSDNTKDSKDFSKALQNKSVNATEYKLLQATIPNAVVFKEATTRRVPIFELNKTKKQQQKATKSIGAMIALIKELGL